MPFKTDREISDTLTGAALLASRGLSAPAGYFARDALEKFLALNRPGESIPEALKSLIEDGSAGSEETGEIVMLLEELAPHLSSKNIYTPGFIQVKIRTLVDRIATFFSTAAGKEIISDPEKLSEKDWKRLEAVLGEIAGRLKETGLLPVEEEDFEDLNILREKVQIWAPSLTDRLLARGLKYKLDSISRINKTSGYIWVALITDFTLKKVEQGSYSLTFTPLHLRAGLEMGGRSRDWREAYYQALLEGSIDDILGDFARLGCSLFDTFWYFNIRDATAVEKFLADGGGRNKAARGQIEKALSRLSEESLYFWNICLPGRLFPPGELAREREAAAELIERIGEATFRLLDRIRP